MTSKDRRAEDREALERLLEIHGADRTRWPARDRLRVAGVISEDKAAAKLLAEAEALDRLLDRAPRASEANLDALKERIVAAALRSQRPHLTAVAGGKGKPAPSEAWLGQLRRPGWAARFHEWPAAAVLAASLVVGVMLGSAGTFDATMQQVASVAGFNTASSAEGAHLASSEEVFGQSDEDLL
jgi:hypothetical protein